MKISIVIPTYNEEKTIGKLIKYLRGNSTEDNIQEIIVVDGHSRDKTILMAKNQDARILHAKKRGRGAQLNMGGMNACGEILFFLHADSYPPQNFDELILENCNKNNYTGCFRLKFDRNKTTL